LGHLSSSASCRIASPLSWGSGNVGSGAVKVLTAFVLLRAPLFNTARPLNCAPDALPRALQYRTALMIPYGTGDSGAMVQIWKSGDKLMHT
jgi:hypothetical protein